MIGMWLVVKSAFKVSDEVILIDDGSDDWTQALKISDNYPVVFVSQDNKGVANARNTKREFNILLIAKNALI